MDVTNSNRSTFHWMWDHYEMWTTLRIRDATAGLDDQEYTCMGEYLDGTNTPSTSVNVTVYEVHARTCPICIAHFS